MDIYALWMFLVVLFIGGTYSQSNEEAGRLYIEKLDKQSGIWRNELALAEWAYGSNVTEETDAMRLNASLVIARLNKIAWEETVTFDWETFEDEDLKRKFSKYSKLGNAALPDDKYEKLKRAVSDMQSNYATAKICDFYNPTKCDLSLEPEITEIMAKSEDAEELKHVWVEWHNAAGAKVKDSFTEYAMLSNEAAQMNDFADNAESWLSHYEQDDFEDEMAKIWEQIRPLYLQIHAYVRRHLNEKYGDDIVNKKGPIPAHLLGNMWAQSWTNLESFTRPYPDKPDMDITDKLIEEGYTPVKMFQVADEFFQSLDMPPMPPKFWENSILEKPDDGRDLVCHASAWDFYDKEDFRIKQCTVVNTRQFVTAHHEMGHVQYFLHYNDQDNVYKGGANPGFHEAVGDVISLSVTTAKHLRKIGLLDDGPDDEESQINSLYSKGIEKIVFLPFAYMLDLFRYAVFREETTPDNYNCHFWQLKEELQGLEPPTERTEEDFDAAAKYHVSADVEYARYYVSFIIQFQFHISLCEKAGEYVPGDDDKKLINCDIYQNKEAGEALSNMLRLGTSLPWQDAMEMITGQRKMDAQGILEYFRPLEEWLKAENEKTGEFIGWEPSDVKYCTDEQKAQLKVIKKPFVDSLNK